MRSRTGTRVPEVYAERMGGKIVIEGRREEQISIFASRIPQQVRPGARAKPSVRGIGAMAVGKRRGAYSIEIRSADVHFLNVVPTLCHVLTFTDVIECVPTSARCGRSDVRTTRWRKPSAAFPAYGCSTIHLMRHITRSVLRSSATGRT